MNTNKNFGLLFLNVDRDGGTGSTVFGRVVEKLMEGHLQQLRVCPYRLAKHHRLNIDGMAAEFLQGCLDAPLDKFS